MASIPALIDRSIDSINRFHQAAQHRGATVYFSYPPVPRKQFDENTQEIGVIVARIEQRLTVPRLNRPDDMCFDPTMFYDTVYHLNGRGASKRTQAIIDALIPRL